MPAVSIKCKGSRWAKLESLTVIQGDLKELSEENYAKLRNRIETHGFDAPIFVWKDKILDGTQRYRVLGKMVEEGWTLPKGVPVCDIQAKNLSEAKERLLGYVSQFGKLTEDGLYEFLQGIEEPDLATLDLPDFDWDGFEAGFLSPDEGGLAADPDANTRASLEERFIVPPFSVLDARQGYWQERKRAWLAIGIQSELGRGEAYPGGSQRDAATLGPDGKTVRGDGVGKPIAKRERERE